MVKTLKEQFSLQIWQTCGNGWGIYLITKNEPILIGKVYESKEEAKQSLLDMKCVLSHTYNERFDKYDSTVSFVL